MGTDGAVLGGEMRGYPSRARTLWLGALAGAGGIFAPSGDERPFLFAPAVGVALGASGARHGHVGAAWELRYIVLPYPYESLPSVGESVPSGPQHLVTVGISLHVLERRTAVTGTK